MLCNNADRGTFMKARTQSLAQVAWLPDCPTVNCATENHKTAAAKQPVVIGSHSLANVQANVQAQLAYDGECAGAACIRSCH